MAKAKNTQTTKPFSVKGQRLVSPKGETLWCKVKEADYQYNPKGILSVQLVCDPDDELVQAFIEKLEALRDEAFLETKETLGAKGKGIKARPVYNDNLDAEGEETGFIEFKFSLKDIDDRDTLVKVVDSKKQIIKNIPLIGNGSVVRCIAYANPYYMASTKEVGTTLIWEQLQILKLEEYSAGGDFDDIDDEEEDGYVSAPIDDFEEDDEEYDTPPVKTKAKPKAQPTPTKTKPKAKPKVEEEDEEEEDEEVEEEEEEETPKPKPKAKPKAPVKPKPAPAKRKAPVVEEEDEDEDADDF